LGLVCVVLTKEGGIRDGVLSPFAAEVGVSLRGTDERTARRGVGAEQGNCGSI
jgi:hypothetical protein